MQSCRHLQRLYSTQVEEKKIVEGEEEDSDWCRRMYCVRMIASRL